ncbi:MAG: hypothetical protein WCB01_05755 [Candidatus Cybelea sp.]
MRFTQQTLIAAAATAAIVASAGAVMAHGFNGSSMNMITPASQSYSGSWPVTVKGSQFSNGTLCLTLTQSGKNGGSATLVKGDQKFPYGSFLILNGILMATIQEQLYGQNGALTFTAGAHRGNIGQGMFENIEGGSNFDFGKLEFGMKNGC